MKSVFLIMLVASFLIPPIILPPYVTAQQNATIGNNVTTNLHRPIQNMVKTHPEFTDKAVTPSPCLVTSSDDLSSQTIQPSSVLQSIKGHVLPVVKENTASVVSSMPSTFQLHMELTFKIRRSASFQSCLDSINDPRSSYYHHFLNGTTLAPYVPTPGVRSSVVNYLQSNGITVTNGFSPLTLKLTAPVGVVENLFGIKTHLYNKNGQPNFYASDSDPAMPENYASQIIGIGGLENYTRIRPAAESPSTCSGPYCPQGIQIGYSISSLHISGYNGTGQNIAIVDAAGDPNIQSAIDTYDAQYGLQSTALNVLYPDGQPSSWDPGWATETAMDVEAVHTVAPGSTIYVIYLPSSQNDLMDGVDYIASHNLAKVVSNSWEYGCLHGSCNDIQLSSAYVSSHNTRLATDSAQGLTILFASGDEGAKPDGTNLGTEFPASDPNVLSVGATNLNLTGCVLSTCSGYGNETGAVISGGGYSGHFPEPSWQSAVFGQISGRGVPDVSMLGYNKGFWVYSTNSDHCTETDVSLGPGWFGCAGTSLSTPLWAGMMAIIIQEQGGSAMGNIAPTLWGLAGSSLYSHDFHDIQSGGNNGYQAGLGWDPVTGWGTPVTSNLTFLTNFGIANQASCLALPTDSNPSWNYTTNTCTISGTLTLTGYALTIYSGMTLKIASGGTITVNSGGNITNSGTITIANTGVYGIFNNGGIINNNSGGQLIVSNTAGTGIYSNGTINNNSGGKITVSNSAGNGINNQGTLANFGAIYICNGTTIGTIPTSGNPVAPCTPHSISVPDALSLMDNLKITKNLKLPLLEPLSLSGSPTVEHNSQQSNIKNVTISSGAASGQTCVSANNCFSPNVVNIAPNDTVTWINDDNYSHTVTSGNVNDSNAGSMFDSGLIKSGKTFQFTFPTAGTYDYFCTVHPWMTGIVTVTTHPPYMTALLTVYNARPDLQSAFPEAASGHYNRLLSWAGTNGINENTGTNGIHESALLKVYTPVYEAMEVYNARPDLQSAFPEANNGTNVNNLLAWAGSNGITEHPAILGPYTFAYKTMYVYNNRPDLKSAFPEASNGINMNNLLAWAGSNGITEHPAILGPYAYAYKTMYVYNNRPDLKSAFPEASNGVILNNLLAWAGLFGIIEHPTILGTTPTPAAQLALMYVYNNRPDLQTSFPEAFNGVNLVNLYHWAAQSGVTEHPTILGPYAAFYTTQ